MNEDGTMKEMLEEVEQELKQMANDLKICKPDENGISLWDGNGWYEIAYSQYNTHQKIVELSCHLMQKRWITLKHMELFYNHVARHFNYPFIPTNN